MEGGTLTKVQAGEVISSSSSWPLAWRAEQPQWSSNWCWCSSHRSISFRESMPPPRDLVIHWPINWQSALIPSSFQELFFLDPFLVGWQTGSHEPAAQTDLCHIHCYWFHLELHHWRKHCCKLHTRFLQTKDQHTDQWHKRDTFSLLLLYTCYNNKPFFLVLFIKSFVIHLCCQIIYSVREINHFPKH